MEPSSVTPIDEALAGVSRLGLDTAPIIYLVEDNPLYIDRILTIFRRLADGQIVGITSVITLCEVLIHPLRHGNNQLEQEYRRVLLGSDDLRIRSVGPGVARHAADLRARYSLRLPDALQVATALRAGCQAFLTNDAGFRRVAELRVLLLDELTV
jgi:predicted nucleic acid-binding protein